MNPKRPIHVLFVCLGNICRSPLAEGVFVHKAAERGLADRFVVESAGTGNWHAGDLPDARMRSTAQGHGVNLTSRARQVVPADYERFDFIICMDESNHRDLLSVGAPKSRVRLLLDADPDAPVREVPDPYYGEDDGFETVYQLVSNACDALLDEFQRA